MEKSRSSSNLKQSWKVAKSPWIHSLHHTCSRTGAFPPILARYFILRYSDPENLVLDPFSGKGTAPLEACIFGRKGIGNDISPEAFVLTHAMVRPVDLGKALDYIKDLEEATTCLKFDLRTINRNVRLFYDKETLRQILKVRFRLKDQLSDTAFFIKALMCGILHGSSGISLSLPCSHSFSMSPNYVRNYVKENKLERPLRNVFDCLRKKARNVLKDDLLKIKGEAHNLDARKIPVESSSVDLIVTSPPYMNKQTYAWDNWLRLWFLGFDYKQIRKGLFRTGSTKKYVEWMSVFAEEMFRILKHDSACFMVIGDVKIGDRYIETARILVEPFENVGFKVHNIIDDSFLTRAGPAFTFNSGSNKKDDERRKKRRTDRILALYKGDIEERDLVIDWKATCLEELVQQNLSTY